MNRPNSKILSFERCKRSDMCAALHLAGPHRQERLGAIQRLDLWLFIDAEDRRVLRRTHIQPHDVADFLHEQRVGRALERLAPMRLQAEGAPYPLYCRD